MRIGLRIGFFALILLCCGIISGCGGGSERGSIAPGNVVTANSGDLIVYNTFESYLIYRKIGVISPSGTGQEYLTDGTYDDYYPVWSTDGSQIAFCSMRTGDSIPSLYIMNADGSNVTKLKEITEESCDGIKWSPRGDYIAFISHYIGSPRSRTAAAPAVLVTIKYLNVIKPDGSGFLQLASDVYSNPMWSLDGTKIYYQDMFTDRYASIKPDGTGKITINSEFFGYPMEVSPDGSKMLFVYWDAPADKISNATSQKSGLFYGSPDASGLYYYLAGESSSSGGVYTYFCDTGCSWSTDGSKIVYDKKQGDMFGTTSSELYTINADGSQPILLLQNAEAPNWKK